MSQTEATSENDAPAKVARTVLGRVTSDKMDKTITVEIERRVRHPLYRKYVRKLDSSLHAHDEENDLQHR